MSACTTDDWRRRRNPEYSSWTCTAGHTCPKGYVEMASESRKGCIMGLGTETRAVCAIAPESYNYDEEWLVGCCLGTNPEIDCAPGFCRGSTKCDNLMKKRCSVKFTNDGQCKQWCMAHQGQCDQGARDYVRRNPTDKAFGGCLLSPTSTSKGGSTAIPSCFDGNCIANGYQTAEMVSAGQNCPSVCAAAINCYQESNGTCNISENQMQINCGQGLPALPDNKPGPTPGPTPDPAPAPKPGMKNSVRLILIIILLLLAALLTVALVAQPKPKVPAAGAFTTYSPGVT